MVCFNTAAAVIVFAAAAVYAVMLAVARASSAISAQVRQLTTLPSSGAFLSRTKYIFMPRYFSNNFLKTQTQPTHQNNERQVRIASRGIKHKVSKNYN